MLRIVAMVTFQSRSIQIKISDYFEEIAFQWLTNTEKKYIHSSLESRGATILGLLKSRNNNEKIPLHVKTLWRKITIGF